MKELQNLQEFRAALTRYQESLEMGVEPETALKQLNKFTTKVNEALMQNRNESR